MRIQRVETIYDQGDAKYPEDGFVAIRHHGLFGVVDGFSAPYMGKPELFNGKSGGQVATKMIIDIANHYPRKSLKGILSTANEGIGFWAEQPPIITPGRADLLPGASFVFVRIGDKTAHIVQAGDCLAVWQYLPGEDETIRVGGTKNQAYGPVSENLATIARLVKKHSGDKEKAWTEFLPILSAQRLRDINQPNGYASLNGQYDTLKYWQELTIPVAGLQYLMLFSDGFVPYDLTKNMDLLARDLLFDYEDMSLADILAFKRRDDEVRNIPHDEATAIALTFA